MKREARERPQKRRSAARDSGSRGATATLDPVSNVLHDERPTLDAIFAPRTVAIVGATERPGSVGRTVAWNLLNTPFGGTVFPVNPARATVFGRPAHADLRSVPERVDLAVVATPAGTVPGVIHDAVSAGVRSAVIISAGFRETGSAGELLEQEILAEARRGGLRIIGPNCLGVMNPHRGLNATFASAAAQPGTVAFLSQSGALCTAVLDWSFRENVGFSAFVSVGSMLDVGWGDLIAYLGDDPRTRSILIYMETVGDAAPSSRRHARWRSENRSRHQAGTHGGGGERAAGVRWTSGSSSESSSPRSASSSSSNRRSRNST